MRSLAIAASAGLVLIATGVTAAPARTAGAQEALAEASFNQLKVTVVSKGQTVFGSGVWLGRGYVLTANHLFRRYQKGDTIQVALQGKLLTATLRSQGDLSDADLALLEVRAADSRAITWAGPSICTRPEAVGAKLQVNSYDQGFTTYASPEGAIAYKDQMWSENTVATFSPGVSGSPVFDSASGCLAGIISRYQVTIAMSGPNLAEQGRCAQATRQDMVTSLSVTCAVSAPTRFSSLERLRAFLADAGVSLDPPRE